MKEAPTAVSAADTWRLTGLTAWAALTAAHTVMAWNPAAWAPTVAEH